MDTPVECLEKELKWIQQIQERNINSGLPDNGINLQKDIDAYEKAIQILNLSSNNYVIKSVCDLDGKTIPVKFKVSKFKPKVYLDD